MLFINGTKIDDSLGTVNFGDKVDLDNVYFNGTLVWNKKREYTLTFANPDSYLRWADIGVRIHSVVKYAESDLPSTSVTSKGTIFYYKDLANLPNENSLDNNRDWNKTGIPYLPAQFSGTGLRQKDTSNWWLKSSVNPISPPLTLQYPPTLARQLSATYTSGYNIYPIYGCTYEEDWEMGDNWGTDYSIAGYKRKTPTYISASQLNNALRSEFVSNWYNNDWNRNWVANDEMFPPNYTGWDHACNLSDANVNVLSAGYNWLYIDWLQFFPKFVSVEEFGDGSNWLYYSRKAGTYGWYDPSDFTLGTENPANKAYIPLILLGATVEGATHESTILEPASYTRPIMRFINQNDTKWYADVEVPWSNRSTTNFTSMTFKAH